MALKDWKKIGKMNWEHKFKTWKYNNGDIGDLINIKIDSLRNNTFVVFIPYNKNVKHFKTKQQALKFAKAYMRKH